MGGGGGDTVREMGEGVTLREMGGGGVTLSG